MKSGKDILIKDEMLIAHFSNQLNDEENEKVVEWASISEENQKKYQEWKLLTLDVEAISSLKENKSRYNTELAWKSLDFEKEKSKSSKRWVWYAAASLIIGLVSFFILLPSFEIEPKEQVVVLTPNSANLSNQLYDGSTVSLNKNSELTILPENETTRRVILDGEAYFEIAQEEDRPFIVQANGLEVEVLGTSFNVSVTEDSTVVSVDEGLVKLKKQTKELFLTAGMSGVYYTINEDLKQRQIFNTGIDQFWLKKKLKFGDHTLLDISNTLERAYQVEIVLSNIELKNCRLSVTFDNMTIEEVMQIIATTLQLEIKKENQIFYLNGKACN